MDHRVVADYTKVDSTGSNVSVYVRARPLEDKSEESDFISTNSDRTQITIKDPNPNNRKYGEVNFQFDRIFWTDAGQDDVFNNMCKAHVDHTLDGFNSCCFAYGQTGSGKTYTMFGGEGEIRGIIPRAVEYLFANLGKKSKDTEIATVCSFLEIYNDQIRDLGKAYLVAMGVEASSSAALFEKTSDIFESLAGKRGNPYFGPVFHKTTRSEAGVAKRPGLKEVQDEYNTMNYDIREDSEGNVFVKDLSLVPVTTLEEAMSMISMGLRVRATHETKMNATSSRSHTVFTVTVLQRDKLTGQAITGMLNLVDLAGSERLKKSESAGIRLKEALHINTSLTALGKVVMALDPSSETTHVPYRDSKLTRVLQNSLGGNSYTSVMANIHPRPTYFEECLSTLQFANRCRNVRNNPRVNYVEDTEDKDRRIKRLLEEINTLRAKVSSLEAIGGGGGGPGSSGHGPGNNTKITNAKMISILGKMGIHAMLTADGNIAVNGRNVKVDDLGLGGGASVATEDSGGVGFEADPAFAKQLKRMKNEEKLKEQVTQLLDANDKLTQKNSHQKTTLESQQNQIKDLSDDVLRLGAEIAHKDIEYSDLKADKDREVSDLIMVMEQRQKEAVEQLMVNNIAITAEQGKALACAGSVFKEYTDRLYKQSSERDSIERVLRRQFEKHLEKLEFIRVEERANVKMQYDYWLNEKDESVSCITKLFNEYRAKKSEQLRMCEKELIALYDYAEKIDRILDEVEKGSFRVKQHQGATGRPTTGMIGNDETVGQVLIPRGMRPTNPFHTAGTAFTLTKNLITKHRERVAKQNAIREEAFYHSMHKAGMADTASQVSAADGSLAQQLTDFIAPPAAIEKPPEAAPRQKSGMFGKTQATIPGNARPNSAGRLRLRTQTASRNTLASRPASAIDGGKIATDPPLNTASLLSPTRLSSDSKAFEFNLISNQLSGDPSEELLLELNKLREEVNSLREQRHFEKLNAASLAEEFASNETFQYIKYLEAERRKMHNQIRDISNQLTSAKIAISSLQRKDKPQ